MRIVSNALYRIDHNSRTVESIAVKNTNRDLKDYLDGLLEQISGGRTNRKFTFGRDSTEIKGLIDQMVAGKDISKIGESAAERLLDKEASAQKGIDHLEHEIQKGVLVIALVTVDKVKKLIISKAEHSDYIDDADLTRRTGLPIKKKTYKALLVQYDEDDEVADVLVYDTHANIAKYWWSDYLELSEYNTDQHNTETAFGAIDKALGKQLKEKFPADHNILRNAVLGYFKSKRTFNIEDLVEETIEQYDPVDSELDVEGLKNKILDLPEKKRFDSKFRIKKEVIKARKLKTIVQLNENIELHLNDHIQNIHDVIKPVIVGGQKYIRIRTDSGYDAFQTN